MRFDLTVFIFWLASSVPFNRLGNEIAVQKSRVGSSGAYEYAFYLCLLTGYSFVSEFWEDMSDLSTACTLCLLWLMFAPSVLTCICFRMESCLSLGVLLYWFLSGRVYLAVESCEAMAWWCLSSVSLSCFIGVDLVSFKQILILAFFPLRFRHSRLID